MEVVDFVIGPIWVCLFGVFFFFFAQICQVGELAISTRGMSQNWVEITHKK
jgi:hypothetical protein